MLIPDHLNTYFYLPVVDFRKSINGLSVLVIESMNLSLDSDQIYLFHNRRGDKLKALHYSHHCFSLVYCRLEKGKWILPKGDEGHLELSQSHLSWLLSSHQYSRVDALKETVYQQFI